MRATTFVVGFVNSSVNLWKNVVCILLNQFVEGCFPAGNWYTEMINILQY